MEKVTTNAGKRTMSDVTLARNLIIEIGQHCWNGKADMLDRVHQATVDFAKLEKRKPVFMHRRIRSFFHREAAGVRFFEMMELAATRDFAAQREQDIADAKHQHAAFLNQIVATARGLEVSDAEFHREHLEAVRQLAGKPTVSALRNDAGAWSADPDQCGDSRRADHAGDSS